MSLVSTDDILLCDVYDCNSLSSDILDLEPKSCNVIGVN